MSHRSRLSDERAKLNGVPTFANMQQPAPPPQPVALEQLVSRLASKGAPIGYKLATCSDPPMIRIIACCGPIEIPIDLDPQKTRALAARLIQAADQVDPPVQFVTNGHEAPGEASADSPE
jgi:hypothetical protein